MDEPELDLIMVPPDGVFVPYVPKSTSQSTAKTNGRIFVLKFGSSSQRHLFWLQSKPQHPSGDASFISPRDAKLGQIVNKLLQGEEVNVARELAELRNNSDDRRDDDDDETMEDVEGPRRPRCPPPMAGAVVPGLMPLVATSGERGEDAEREVPTERERRCLSLSFRGVFAASPRVWSKRKKRLQRTVACSKTDNMTRQKHRLQKKARRYQYVN